MELSGFVFGDRLGGFHLGLEWAGFDFDWVGYSDIDEFCNKVYLKHWPTAINLGDIKNIHGKDLPKIDIITAGVPCQPASCAGKRRGTEDDRWLWDEALRIVRECKPRWCIFENPTGILSLQGGLPLNKVLSNLEAEGYDIGPFVLPACGKNAPHKRDRLWIVANDTGNLRQSRSARKEQRGVADYDKQIIGNSKRAGQPGSPYRPWENKHGGTGSGGDWLEVATRLCGIFNGLSTFLDEIGGLNGETTSKIPRQSVPYLWGYVQQEKIWESLGGFKEILNPQNLFAVLWQHFAGTERQRNLPFESKQVQEAFLRNVWVFEFFGCSPQRWEYKEQRPGKLADSLPSLSYEVALETKELVQRFNRDRVDRLKALGNAVVPQIVQVIGKQILKVETLHQGKEG